MHNDCPAWKNTYGDYMYIDLQTLLKGSSSTRSYFVSLPVETQLAMHENNKYIHTAFELRKHVSHYEQMKRISN